MKILMLNYEYPPLGGGAANATYYLLREFNSRKDIEVDLVTSSAKGILEIEQFSDLITIHKLPIRKKSIHYWTLPEIISYSLKARSYIKNLKPDSYDLIHAFFGIPCGVLAHRYRKKTPYVVSLRGSDVPGFNERFSLQYILLNPIIRKVWKDAAFVVSNSVGLSDLAHKTEPGLQIEMILNGIDLAAFPVRVERNDGNFVILTVARLIKRKGIGDLIEAMPIVIEKCRNVKLIIIGEGNLERELCDQVSELGLMDFIEFKGYVPHENLPKYYALSNLFVLPSYNEGMSNTILEAMAAGLPIITTNTGGTSELIEGNGIVVQAGDTQSIGNAILQYIYDPNMIANHGEKSREKAKLMEWGQVANQYYQLFCEVI